MVTHQQLQMAGARRKQRRRSLEEKTIRNDLLSRVSNANVKPSSEEDSEPTRLDRLSRSAAHPSAAPAASAQAGASKNRNASRRQLFTGLPLPLIFLSKRPTRLHIRPFSFSTDKSPATPPAASPGHLYTAPSWLNFRLNMAPIMACFE